MADSPTANVPKLDRFTGRSAAGLAGIAGAGIVFGLLVALVRLRWAPLEHLDHGVAADLNRAVTASPFFLTIMKMVTTLGGPALMWAVTLVGVAFLLIRAQPRLAAYLAVAGAGALVLDPTLKQIVGRLRPVVAHPVAHGTGNSFPSGHTLGATVVYGALLLLFLPGVPRRLRRPLTAVVVLLVVMIGFSRLALGVHFLSDVVGAWALGVAWLGLTAHAFEVWRRQTGRRRTEPLREGLEPEAGPELAAAPGSAAAAGAPAPRSVRGAAAAALAPGRTAAIVLVGWVITFGVLVGFGELIIRYGGKNLLGDTSIPRWFALHRTHALTSASLIFSDAGDTHWILYIGLVTGAILLAALRRWRPVVFLVVAMFGELSLFLATAAVIGRPRPPVSHLDAHLPTSSYPSGHVAATLCLYVTIALFAISRGRAWWRWLFLAPAVAMPVLVALFRMYRGMHHPTDVAASAVLAALWLATLWFGLRPNAVAPGTAAAGRAAGTGGGRLRPRGREAVAPATGARQPQRRPLPAGGRGTASG